MDEQRDQVRDETSAAELAAMESAVLPPDQQAAVQEYWQAEIEKCYAAVADAPQPTSWLVSSTADQRRIHRAARRAGSALLRALPSEVTRRQVLAGPDEQDVA